MVLAWAPRWEKKEKKIGERSDPRGILAGGDRSARDIFFLFDPVFCLFPQLRSLVPGYMVTIDFKVGEIKKLESSEAYLLNLGKNLSWAFEVIYIFCKNAV